MRRSLAALLTVPLAITLCLSPIHAEKRKAENSKAEEAIVRVKERGAPIPANGYRRAARGAKAENMDLSPLETQVLGQNRWLRGGPAALRVIVTDHQSGKPVAAQVTLSLAKLENGKPTGEVTLTSGKTDGLGTLTAQFTAPKSSPGAYQLTVAVHSKLGQESITQPIQLQESTQLLLTCDKPLYQPGQTMHLRALGLDMATREALWEKPVTFEIEDARGNKVFKKRETLSKFGIAGVDFVLADEVNMGTFTLRAVLPDGQTEKKVRVERYVLPKFKISVEPEKPYYLPGEMVKGVIKAKYFFGKPVADSPVTIEINTIDIGVTKLTEIKDKTDAIGTYTFRYTLPKSFVGQPFEQGKATVEFKVTVKDGADHKQEAHVSVPVVKEPITLVLVPESRALVPEMPNHIYIAAATPDGQPLRNAKLEVIHTEPGFKQPIAKEMVTDDLGLATAEVTPTGKNPVTLIVNVTDKEGRKATVTQTLNTNGGVDGLILRPDKTLAKVGDRLNLTAFSSAKGGTLYLDVIRNRQTILTRAHALNGGQAMLSLPVTPDMVGTLELHAYKILPNENIIRDTRTIVVSPANDLEIRMTADRGEYKPGGEAVLKFAVQDGQKHPVLAALGLAMVDESVFALSELQPGLEKIYFTLEKELMEPKYEIHGLKPSVLIELPGNGPGLVRRDAERQRAAAMLLAAVPPQADFDFRVNTYQQRWEKMRTQVLEEMVKAHQKILDAIQKYRAEQHVSLTEAESLQLLVEKGYLKDADLKDRWGHHYKTNLYGQHNYDGAFALSSAGPDGRWGTVDDLVDVSIYRSAIRRFAFGGGRGGALQEQEVFGLGAGARPEGLAMPARALAMDGAVDRLALATQAEKGEATRSKSKQDGGGAGGGAAIRVREYFPETMYWNPALLTDEKGIAELRLPIADSITTWRMSMTANSMKGQLGSTTAPVKVFQDFFVDIDLPVSMTQNDRVELPVAVYNYMAVAQSVTLTLKEEPWFALQGGAQQVVHIEPGQVKVVHYPIVIKAIGQHALTVQAKGTKLSDAVRRQIAVLPDGKEIRTAINDRLEGKVEKTLTVPDHAIKGASTIWVKLFPGSFSQVVDGLDGMLRMPNGCFEQTSSTTYPNILVLDYLKANKKINPELQMRAEQYINIGYQRLVTFECKSGGFSWFGNEPAHQILTAYGLLEFGDMAKVHEVDPSVIGRTQGWLAGRQNADGSWEEKGQGIAEGIINRQTGALRGTAYIAWALAESGYQGPQVAKGVSYVKEHRFEAKDPYTLAVILNLLTRVERDSDTTAQVANDLIGMAKVTEKAAYWQSDTKTFTGASSEGADLETTGLAAYALVKWGRNAGFTNKVLTHLVQSKDSFGTWSSTQGTVWAMKSLLFASRNGVGGGGKGSVTVLANGQKAATFAITPDDSDVMRQVNLAETVRDGANTITLQYEGDGSLLYQIVERHYLPWSEVAPPALGMEPLGLKVEYDKKTLAQDDTATVTVTIHNNTDRIAEMPLIDLGVPPGFSVNPEKLDDYVAKKTISKYTVAARQVIVYLEKLGPGETMTLSYQIKAKFPIKARTPLSKAYPYYNPERVAISPPQDILVQK